MRDSDNLRDREWTHARYTVLLTGEELRTVDLFL